ncbi:hypothetical protein Pla22_16410 [Rubripirellula amarantea]|uniref:Uncharacterized protein n=1 Tax=Rubripirellula amarantea TaxID=2527999 RepID=A0A5C5WTL1_9BACT|nr:hypothetical protein [Rubripirellula amarantea]TWT54007.1 hypothetical protein Pla22_16410 [Rubripirellula amarantea]
MNRILAPIAFLTVAAICVPASAQRFSISIGRHSSHHDSHFDSHHTSRHLSHHSGGIGHIRHTPNIERLDNYADQLAEVARHLHDDAHMLSQDYEHSTAIEAYVSQLERVQEHLHEILHHSANRGRVSLGLIGHVQSDFRQVERLVSKLDRQLSHQTIDGARTRDFHTIRHMRGVIASEMRPLLSRVNQELYGFRGNVDGDIHHGHSHRSTPIISRRIGF